MTRTTVTVEGRAYDVSALEAGAVGRGFQAVVVARLVDARTGGPVVARTRIGTETAGLRGRGTRDGFVGLVGTPSTVLPMLATQSYPLVLRVDAAGFAPRTVTLTVPVQPTFPDTFTPVDLGPLELHAAPVDVEVRTFRYAAAPLPVPVPGAVAEVTGHWARLDDLDQLPATGTLQAVDPGLATSHPAGAGVDVPVLGQPAEPTRLLTGGARAGQTRLTVSRAGGMVVGDLAGLDVANPALAERVEVVAVDAAADLDSPAVLVLRFPLSHDHPDGAPVVRLVAPAPAGAAVLSRPALAGDRTLHLSTAAPLAGAVLRVSGGVAPEYVTPSRYRVTSDAAGVARLPALTGLAAVLVSASSGALQGEAPVSLVTDPRRVLDLTLE